jgi:uncharacterized protein YxjI
METKFFNYSTYLIDEKVNYLKFENEYKVYDENNNQIGLISQKLSGGQKFLRLILNKAMMPFLLEIKNSDGRVEAAISRGWTFFMSKIVVMDHNQYPIGYIKQKFKFFKPTFIIFDSKDQEIGKITGDWKAWNFNIFDKKGNEIGKISKKWNGAMKEIFTSADKYIVSLNGEIEDPIQKVSILASAITIDMVLKESK